jgi:carbonic anhydrase
MNRRRTVVSVSAAAAATALAWTLAFGSGGEGVGVSADEALKRLMEGNKRYVAGSMCVQSECTTARRAELAKGQKPYAIILCCSDSRVPPEIVFDKAMGEIFVVRVAGNIPDPVVLGSIEYAAEHIGSPLVMVLGHERCGAVKATVETVRSKGKVGGNLGAVVSTVTPAAKAALKAGKGKSADEVVESAVDFNTRAVRDALTKRSPVLAKLAKEGKIRIVSAKYDLDDGTVRVEP